MSGLRRASSVFVAAAVAITVLGPVSVRAQGHDKLSQILNSLARSVEASEQDAAIQRAFREVLNREPTDSEFRRYRGLMHDEHWSEREVRDDLRSRNDYRRHRSSSSDVDPDRVIRRAYEDILNREPDTVGLRDYRTKMIDEGWTEQDVRAALRKSAEHAKVSQASADRIVRRAYQDILGREPDYNGLVDYRNEVMDHGWDEHDVREALKRSAEYRQRNAITRQQAEEIVTRAYRGVLGRDPDAGGLGDYSQRVMRDHWSEADVAKSLRNSEEYRSKHR
jgi:TorA maturation chaperone TorD